MNKTSISSVVCFDIIDFAKKSIVEKQAVLKQFNALVNRAVVDIPQKDRMIVETGHGAIITCSGSLESALEDALFIAITVRDELLDGNTENENPLYLLIGINLGAVKLAKNTNTNEAPNVIGDGLVEAQRIMSFANPNQILVSRAYYDMASKLTLEIAQMFEKYDMHAYEHDIYAVRLLNEKVAAEHSAAVIDTIAVPEESAAEGANNWRKYILPILLALAILFAFIKWMNTEKAGEVVELPIISAPGIEETEIVADPANAMEDDAVQSEVLEEKTEQPKAANQAPIKKKATKKSVKTKKPKASIQPKSTKEESVAEPATKVDDAKSDASTVESDEGGEKSGWDTFKDSLKQGAEKECSQAEMAMNQCN